MAAGLGGGLVFSMTWMIVLRLCAGFIVWFTILAANFLLLAVALYCYSKGGLITASGAVGKVGSLSTCSIVCPKPLDMLGRRQGGFLVDLMHCSPKASGNAGPILNGQPNGQT